MSDLESTLPSGIRQNRDQVGYVPLAELKDRAQAETIKKSEIAKLMQRWVPRKKRILLKKYVLCKVRVCAQSSSFEMHCPDRILRCFMITVIVKYAAKEGPK